MEDIEYGLYTVDGELLENMKKTSSAVVNAPGTVYLGPVFIDANGKRTPMFIPLDEKRIGSPVFASDANACANLLSKLLFDKAVPVTYPEFVSPCAGDRVPEADRGLYMEQRELIGEMLREEFDIRRENTERTD